MMKDYSLLEATMQHIIDHPEQHNQAVVWNCGTPACFIGHAQALSGFTRDEHNQITRSIGTIPWAVSNLNISENDALCIFAGINTIPMLQSMVKDIVNDGQTRDWKEYQREECQREENEATQ